MTTNDTTSAGFRTAVTYDSDAVLARVGDGWLVFSVADSQLYRLTGADAEGPNPPTYWRRVVPQRGSPNAEAVRQYWREPRLTVSAVNLNLTDRCNLACVYCYAKGGDYERIRAPMSPEVAIGGIEAALRRRDAGVPFRLEFFGGEPLLNPETIGAVLDWQEAPSLARSAAGDIVNRISSNLTVLDDRHLELLARGHMIASISLDGPAAIQDIQRPFKDGRGSFALIFENIRRLRRRCPTATIVARMTVYRADDQLLASVRELVSHDLFDYVSIYAAAVGDGKGGAAGRSHFSDTFAQQYLALAAAYPELLGKGRFKGCLELNRYLEAMLMGRTVVNHCRAGAGYYTLSPDRTVHPCHRLVGDPAWNLGLFDWDKTPGLAARLAPWQTPADQREVCSTCPLRYLCAGGCKQQALIATGSLVGHDPRICAFSQLLFDAALTVASRLTSPVEHKLRASFAELSRLFVFCGQPLVDIQRGPWRAHAESRGAGAVCTPIVLASAQTTVK